MAFKKAWLIILTLAGSNCALADDDMCYAAEYCPTDKVTYTCCYFTSNPGEYGWQPLDPAGGCYINGPRYAGVQCHLDTRLNCTPAYSPPYSGSCLP